MQIKITPLNPNHSHVEGIFAVDNNYYLAQFHSAGIVTQIKPSDDWLEQEMAWVSRSEIPFVTAIRHAQIQSPHLVEGAVTPLIRRYHPYFAVEEVDGFPSTEDCMQLVYKYCDHATDAQYHFYRCDIDAKQISKLIEAFDYEDDLLIRAGSCLYKAYILLETSHTFAEEIYINSFIAFEALIEYLISTRRLTGNFARNEVIDVVGEYVTSKEPGVNFADYEAEMRDGIRNNIIHPYRHRTGERIAQPFLMADYIYEDLAFIDWLFKKILERELQ